MGCEGAHNRLHIQLTRGAEPSPPPGIFTYPQRKTPTEIASAAGPTASPANMRSIHWGSIRESKEWAPQEGEPLALVFGNELHGVKPAVLEACDGALVVPQLGSKHSLNVSVCAGILLWWLAGRPDGPVSLPLGRP